MRRIIAGIMIITLVISLIGCGSDGAYSGNIVNLMQDVKQQKSVVEDADEKTAETLTDFAVRLFQNSVEDGKNTLVSPLSVLYALSMTANGAKGETLAQMEEVLGVSVDELNEYMNYYRNNLSKGEKAKMNIANSIWLKDDESFVPNEDFLQTNADYYGADIFQDEFDDETVRNINGWIEDKTDGMIPKVLDKISPDVVMYLINALSFEAEWVDIYTEYQVLDREFTLENGEKQTVSMMHSSENAYLENEYATGFLKYYKGGKYAFGALLPKEGMVMSEFVKTLNGEELREMIAKPDDVEVITQIPKFETEYAVEMSEILKDMGMTDAFDSSIADLSGLGTSDRGNIYISRILHKTYISVMEKGTKAGAATVVEAATESALEVEIKKVLLNRPFVYMLIDLETNTPFFIGTMMKVE